MNRTVLAVLVLAVIIGLAGFMFYDGTANEGDTVIQKADQTTTAPPAK
jgi:cobalamin synthase